MDKKELREKISKILFSYETENGKKSINEIMTLVDNYLSKQLTLTDVGCSNFYCFDQNKEGKDKCNSQCVLCMHADT